MAIVTVDQIKPERILRKIGGYEMAFAESYKGEGGPSDANFQTFDTDWRQDLPTNMEEIWLEHFLRNAVIAGTRAGFNFCEFWGWPEVRVRDDLTCQVASRIRVIKLKIEHKPRMLQ